MQIFDSHAHYNDEKFELDREETLKKVLDAGVKNLICAGYSVESSRQAIKIANEHRYIYATAGISPNDIPTFENENTDVKEFFFEEVLNEHTREAISDTIDILKNQITVVNKGIFHCCPLNLDLIREGLKLGFYISFAGPITFKNSKNATEAISLVPLDRILVETDSPYLAPEPKRGTRNDSSNLIYTLQKIADVKQMSMEEVAKITYENTKNILKINTN